MLDLESYRDILVGDIASVLLICGEDDHDEINSFRMGKIIFGSRFNTNISLKADIDIIVGAAVDSNPGFQSCAHAYNISVIANYPNNELISGRTTRSPGESFGPGESFERSSLLLNTPSGQNVLENNDSFFDISNKCSPFPSTYTDHTEIPTLSAGIIQLETNPPFSRSYLIMLVVFALAFVFIFPCLIFGVCLIRKKKQAKELKINQQSGEGGVGADIELTTTRRREAKLYEVTITTTESPRSLGPENDPLDGYSSAKFKHGDANLQKDVGRFKPPGKMLQGVLIASPPIDKSMSKKHSEEVPKRQKPKRNKKKRNTIEMEEEMTAFIYQSYYETNENTWLSDALSSYGKEDESTVCDFHCPNSGSSGLTSPSSHDFNTDNLPCKTLAQGASTIPSRSTEVPDECVYAIPEKFKKPRGNVEHYKCHPSSLPENIVDTTPTFPGTSKIASSYLGDHVTEELYGKVTRSTTSHSPRHAYGTISGSPPVTSGMCDPPLTVCSPKSPVYDSCQRPGVEKQLLHNRSNIPKAFKSCGEEVVSSKCDTTPPTSMSSRALPCESFAREAGTASETINKFIAPSDGCLYAMPDKFNTPGGKVKHYRCDSSALPDDNPDGDVYDEVAIGAGVSGVAATFYSKSGEYGSISGVPPSTSSASIPGVPPPSCSEYDIFERPGVEKHIRYKRPNCH